MANELKTEQKIERLPAPAPNTCPCCSGVAYSQCCEPFHKGKAVAKTTEELLRSRYSAFAKGEIDYIIKTHHSKTSKDLKRSEIESWSKGSEWHGMKVHQKEAGEAKDEQGVIVFQAQYTQDGKLQNHLEKSFFEKENGVWKFLDAQGIHSGTYVRESPKIGRNDPCTCNSGKKYKKCCGLAA